MSPQIEKQQFRNQTDGWVGVVVIGPKGEDRGAAVEPNGTVWLSEPEQVLTANAPRNPADNPFVAQTRLRTNLETGEQEEYTVTPLLPEDENRFVPAKERFVPGVRAEGASGTALAQAAATASEPTVVTMLDGGALQRHAEVEAQGDDAIPNVRPAIPDDTLEPTPSPRAVAAAEAAAAAEAEIAAQASQPPVEDFTPQPVEEEPQTPPEAPVADFTPEPVEPVQEEQPVQDETAAVVDPQIGEETGAAQAPTGPAIEGEYAMSEEVGTPSAVEEPAEDAQPAPYVPPQE